MYEQSETLLYFLIARNIKRMKFILLPHDMIQYMTSICITTHSN